MNNRCAVLLVYSLFFAKSHCLKNKYNQRYEVRTLPPPQDNFFTEEFETEEERFINFVTVRPEYFEINRARPIIDWITGVIGAPVFANDAPGPSQNCTSCKCGSPAPKNERIVGGSPVEDDQFPWMAAIYYNNRFSCGGSLITDRYVLTAAHCTTKPERALFRVQFGVHERTKPTDGSVERSIKRILTTWYNAFNNNNDIALLELTYPVAISDRVSPICLPQPAATYEGIRGIVTGWGRTKTGGGLSGTLQQTEVPILSNRECRRAGYWAFQITNKMICAGYLEGGKDSCQGDSGGPLQVLNDETDRYEIVGLVSWGRACAQKNFPGVYTRVNQYLNWINRNIKDSCLCS
ncbi:trypsin 3A1-like [Anopheles ziemanni]|uniref:trypsin 3A1-like n=1 Tax=Anopheles coustani TaxID=139045 RepID=UPI00265AFA03|nr:trypsin 3A1-like [Anopheles coustani]XP_058169846.1 trypsin 3A1-like [Anopheles ziemanni]